MRPKFKVYVAAADIKVDGELEVHVTRNGFQWQVVTLQADEAEEVAEAITNYLSSAASRPSKEDK